MKILAFDTSANICSTCVFDSSSETVLSERQADIGRKHAEHLMVQIETCLDEAGLDYSALDRIGITTGPGSFTGVRVGVAVAKGLALSLKKPSIGISALDACAHAMVSETGINPEILLTLLDARRGEVYYHNPLLGSGLASYDKLAEILPKQITQVCGSGSELFLNATKQQLKLANKWTSPPIGTVAKLAAQRNQVDCPADPLYFRSADAKPQSGFALTRADNNQAG
ncbi:MAG: tRNA (adenosine(37)-N6)-threonylcarbamoyltransferase complex dimerization subunit type 1 TsaB [Pseudomonadota bacterium]